MEPFRDLCNTLYAFSANSRLEWCQKIIEAKTKHAAALFSQNAEPFRLRVLADTAFAYSDQSHGSKSVMIKGTPLHRAIVEVEKKYEGEGRPPPVGRTAVNCATVFQQPPGRMMCAIGTDFGVYMSDLSNPRGWHRVNFPLLLPGLSFSLTFYPRLSPSCV